MSESVITKSMIRKFVNLWSGISTFLMHKPAILVYHPQLSQIKKRVVYLNNKILTTTECM